MTVGKTVPELDALSAPVVGTDVLTFYRAPGPLKRTTASVLNTYITSTLGPLATLTPGTGVATALAINVGSAGAFVTFNGALGTPSSGTLTNVTGLPIAGLVSSTSTPLGVGSLELGNATDTTITRSSAGNIAVEGNLVYRAGGTDVPITDGGTGASTAATGLANLGGVALTDLAASTGAALVGSITTGTGATARTVQAKLRDIVSVKDFGAVGDGATDDTAALAAARAFLAAAADPPALYFPSGIYLYSTSPNWGISNTKYIFDGEVRLRYTGTGNAVIIDGGATGPGVYNVMFGDGGRPKIDCPSTALDALYVRAVQNSNIKAQVMGAGSASAGLHTLWCVSSTFDVVCSVNDSGWYLSAKPDIGFNIDKRASDNLPTSYCTFMNCDASGPSIGFQLTNTLGNSFFGGVAQACSLYGVFGSTGSNLDKFYGTDFEVNTVADIYLAGGSQIMFRDCDTESLVIFAAACEDCGLSGGMHKSVTIDAGARNTLLSKITYNRSNSGGTISDNGTGTVRRDCTKGNVFNATDAAIESEADVYISLYDDFLNATLAPWWNGVVGTDPQCLAPGVAGSVQRGLMAMIAGDDAAGTMATNGVVFNAGVVQWRADQKGLEITFRVYMDAITNVAFFLGFTDTIALEMPFTLGAGDALTSNASNAVGVLFDTAADTDNWWLVGVANDVDATKQNLGVAPTANVFETFKLYVDAAGTARLFRNNVALGSDMSLAVTPSTLLTPVLAGFSRTTGTRLFACDFINMKAQR